MTDLNLLKTLYWIHSPSGHEYGMQGFIRQQLQQKGIKFYIDEYNQTFNFDNSGRPLVVAHADQVTFDPCSKIFESNNIVKGDSNLGADDKNGVWIVLNLLDKYPDLNFCFSNKEETEGDIESVLYYEQDSLSKIPYCLVFDRRGGSDIIGNWNGYCSEEFEDEICEVGLDFGFRTGFGTFSDCDEISEYLNCVNISCGYYKAHTKQEYTVKWELLNSLEFGKEIIEKVTGPFKHTIINKGLFGGWSYKDLKNDSYSACPKCYTKMNFLEVYDDVGKTDTVYGEYCPQCHHEVYYSSYRSNGYGGRIEYKPEQKEVVNDKH